MKKIALIYATYDGLVNTMCGVGVISQSFVNSFPVVRKQLLKQGFEVDLHLISVALKDGALGYSNDIKNESIRIAKKCGGQLYYVLNGTNGLEQFGSVENWKLASVAAANKSLEISTGYCKTIVFCIDIPFMYTPYYISQQKEAFGNVNIEPVIVLHSDVLSHEAEDPDMERLAWESSAIKYSCLKPIIKFARTSEFLMKHLKNNYSINENKIVPLQSGLDLTNPKYQYMEQKKIKKFLETYGIPTDKDLIFSVGRAVSYKGFESLIHAFAKLKNKNTHLVFIASPYKFAASNIEQLKKLIEKYKISCTPIYKLDMELPKIICQWEKTKICAQLSSHEPFGLVPEEVRVWAKNAGPVILTSNREGFIEQITDNIDGFTVPIENVEDISKKLEYILSLPKEEIDRIKQRGYLRAIENYDYQKSIYSCLKTILK